MAVASVIQIADLTKTFQTEDIETHALSGINLVVELGDFLAIIGPSGSGKTMLATLGLTDRPTSAGRARRPRRQTRNSSCQTQI